MGKINGYTKEEAQSLVKFVCEGKVQGKTLTRIFSEYAQKAGRAKGSVRNYYYALLKSSDNKIFDFISVIVFINSLYFLYIKLNDCFLTS